MRLAAGILGVDGVPRMSRPAYLTELRHISLWSFFAALIDGQFSGIVVSKTFHGSELLVSTVFATPMLAHVLSLVFGVVIRGRPKVRLYLLFAACSVMSAASVALTPASWGEAGGWIFAGQVAVSRIFLSGIVTLRSSLWRANYPGPQRAQIAGRIQRIQIAGLLLASATSGTIFDNNPALYRVVYPVVSAVGALSLLPMRRLRVRNERRERREHRRRLGAGGGLGSLAQGIRESLAILRTDRAYARYCTAQYFLGSANFMIDPVVLVVITKRLHFGYFESSLAMDLIRTAVALVTIRYWSRLFDRVGVLQFRVINSVVWLISFSLIGLSMWAFLSGGAAWGATAGLTLLYAARVAGGAGMGGGAIAWNLGHLHFASERDSDLYMGTHVALTGFRGIIMPFVGTFAFAMIGAWSFAIAVGLCAVAVALFVRLRRESDRGEERRAKSE